MDKKLKELERLVLSDPNPDNVSRLHYYHNRLEDPDLFRKMDIRDNINQEIHEYFGSESKDVIRLRENTRWMIEGNKIEFNVETFEDWKEFFIANGQTFIENPSDPFDGLYAERIGSIVRKNGYALVNSTEYEEIGDSYYLLREENEVKIGDYWNKYQQELSLS